MREVTDDQIRSILKSYRMTRVGIADNRTDDEVKRAIMTGMRRRWLQAQYAQRQRDLQRAKRQEEEESE
jgi:ribosome-interacting GTPase 1